MEAEERAEELVAEAWGIIEQLVKTGKATLASGKVVSPDDEALVRHYQWLASLRRPRRKVTLPEDVFKPKETV